MAYSLLFARPVLFYLRNHQGLSRSGRVRLFTNLDHYLRQRGDVFLQDQSRRLSDVPLRFWYAIVLYDPWVGGLFRSFWFVVNGASAAFGVLTIEYADEGGPPPLIAP